MAEEPAVKGRAHQESDVEVGRIALFGFVLLMVCIAIMVATHFSLSFADRRPARGTADRSPLAADEAPPEPRLQTSPAADMAAFRAHEDAILNSSGWIDERAGVARIPIAAAKKLLLERGLPVEAPAASGAEAGPGPAEGAVK